MSAQYTRFPLRTVGALTILIAVLGAFTASARASAPSTKSAPVATGTIYGGSTSQNAAFVLTLAADHKHITGAVLQVMATCSDGSQLPYFGSVTFEPSKPPVLTPGDTVFVPDTLSRTGAINETGSSVGPEAFTGKLTGHVVGDRASGTLSATVAVKDPQTGAAVTCRTGALRWLAVSAAGRIFAGATSQDFPVVVEKSTGGGTVAHLRFGWAAPCSDSQGAVITPDQQSGLPLSPTGVFDRSFPVDATSDTTSIHAQETVHGQVSATRASGTFSLSLTLTDPSMPTPESCDTGSVHWSARTSAKARTVRP